jgi:hypothetical protein
MKLMMLPLLFLLAFTACNKTTVNQPTTKPDTTTVSTPTPAPEAPVVVAAPPVVDSQPADITHSGQGSTPIGPEYPIKNPEKVFTAKIKATNYTAAQQAKLDKAMAAIEKVVNSPEWKNRVVNNTYNKKATPFDSNKGLSNEQIFEKLFAGAESLIPAVNYQMDLTVTMYYKSNSVVGYTTPSSMIVNTNSKFHDKFDACEISGNLYHEWTHKMGFDHASAKSYNSVPYSLGYAMRDFCYSMKLQ